MESARETINNIMNERGFRHKHQVADYFGVSPQALSIWIAKNQIPPKHLLKISQEKNSQQAERSAPDGLSASSGSKEELQSVVNYLMRENNALKEEIRTLKQGQGSALEPKGGVFDKVFADSLYISGRVSDGVIVDLDGKWESVMGYKKEQLAEKQYDSKDLIHPNDLEHVKKLQTELNQTRIISSTRYSTIQRWKHGKTGEYVMLSMVWDVDVDADTVLVVCKPIDGFINV
tara:strand:+ start:2544 stop:3239 length:696 start_codon:yes stop_codon:yes gene_type:complete